MTKLKQATRIYRQLSGLEKLEFMHQNALQTWPGHAPVEMDADNSGSLEEDEDKPAKKPKNNGRKKQAGKKPKATTGIRRPSVNIWFNNLSFEGRQQYLSKVGVRGSRAE
jgi:hypothetical protein